MSSDVEATKIGDHNVVEAKGMFIVYSLNFNIKCPHRGSIYKKIYRTIYLVDTIDAYHLIHVHE